MPQMRTNNTARKVKFASLGGALGVILAYFLNQFGLDLTPEVEGAITVVISALLAWGMGYLVEPDLQDEIIPN